LKNKIVLVGASTGGPSIIKEMLKNLECLSSTVVIVQHMREEVIPFFIKDLQESLKCDVYSTPIKTTFTKPSVIICAESCIVRKNYATYEFVTDKQNQRYTPDINKLFSSFAPFAHDFDMSVLIMTGIGADGVDGAKELKAKGAKIYAQDEKSSPVYGMPRVAIESGIVDKVKSIDEIKECFRRL
jgi:two-component system chemotaxis response regulator CheB